MAQRLLHVLDGMGVIGLFITMAIKGSSFPFPVLLIVLTYGYLLNPSLTGMTSIALGMSLAYTIASYIPYTIGFKMEHKIKKRFQKKVKKVQVWFRKYGESIFALARPFTVGNYISYAAGISKIEWWKYGLLTAIGIYPWSFGMLFLGRMSKGNIQAVTQFFQAHRGYIYFGLLMIAAGYISILIFRRRVLLK